MANVLVQESSLISIADAIRTKTNSQNTYTPSQMADAIAAINTEKPIPGLLPVYAFDIHSGYVLYGNWKLGGETISYSDVYEVSSDTTYLIALGSAAGTRFRALFTVEDTTTATETLSGTSVSNKSDPTPFSCVLFTPPSDGYITITKDNEGIAELKTYVYSVPALVNGTA